MNANQLASDCLAYLVRVEGTEHNEHRYTQADNSPEWFAKLVREAHFGLLPNDWSYRFVYDALNLCENCDTEDGPQVDIDAEYPCTRDRLNWFASSLERPEYCDEAYGEFGYSHKNALDMVAFGMWLELERVSRLVWDTLREQASEYTEAEAEVE